MMIGQNSIQHTLSQNEHIYAIVMAGGVGSRLWPLSRKKMPKQFLDFFGDGTMIAKTVARLQGIVKPENILIITNKAGKTLAKKQLPHIPTRNIIVEPIGRNTAPCIALASAYIKKYDPEAIVCVLPADHLISDVKLFQQTLQAAFEIAAKTDALVTIGIKPDRPETGYGYIQANQEHTDLTTSIKVRFGISAHKVKTFAEKPDLETAKGFLASGDFLWNSGVFVWHINSILKEFERCLPQLYLDMQAIVQAIGTRKERKTIENFYSWVHPISIDYGVMEKAQSVYVLEGDFGWSDAGSWDEIFRYLSHEHIMDDSIVLNEAQNVLAIRPKGKSIAVVGIDDVFVIDTKDALLICKRGRSQEVKTVVDALKRRQLEEFM
ncbi:MAG: mannose-1-phosphate guanylyltransferase [Candidatus Thermochlorobacter sp.]